MAPTNELTKYIGHSIHSFVGLILLIPSSINWRCFVCHVALFWWCFVGYVSLFCGLFVALFCWLVLKDYTLLH